MDRTAESTCGYTRPLNDTTVWKDEAHRNSKPRSRSVSLSLSLSFSLPLSPSLSLSLTLFLSLPLSRPLSLSLSLTHTPSLRLALPRSLTHRKRALPHRVHSPSWRALLPPSSSSGLWSPLAWGFGSRDLDMGFRVQRFTPPAPPAPPCGVPPPEGMGVEIGGQNGALAQGSSPLPPRAPPPSSYFSSSVRCPST